MPGSKDDHAVLPYASPQRRRRGFAERFAIGLARNLLAAVWVLLCIYGISILPRALNLHWIVTLACVIGFLLAMFWLWRIIYRSLDLR